MYCTEGILTDRVKPVQQQTNTVYCLFALLFLKHIADTQIQVTLLKTLFMMNHLPQCVKRNQFNVFPKSESFTTPQGKKISVFPLLHS